jgi:hypothetical protein
VLHLWFLFFWTAIIGFGFVLGRAWFSSSFITFVALFCSVLGCLQTLLFEFEPKDLLAISPKIKDLMAIKNFKLKGPICYLKNLKDLFVT